MVVLPVNERALVQLESALELHRHQQEPKSERIAFSDFCKIASKVDASPDVTAADDDDDDKSKDGSEKAQSTSTEDGDDALELWKLSKAERSWHDLYCVAVPTLYRETDTPETTERSSSSQRNIAMASLTLRMCGAEKSSSSKNNNNRMKELRKLVQEARSHGVPRERSDRAVRFLFDLRNEKQLAAAEKKSPRKEKNTKQFRAEFFLSQTEDAADVTARSSTIEDRIRARAKERQDNLAQAEAARKDPREERVAIADALYSYACRILRKKRSRLGEGGQKHNQTKCVAVTFKEVVQGGLASNRPRNDVMRLFSDIVQVLSSEEETTSSTVFLKWKDPKTGERNVVPIPKTATVWIDSTDFKKVREILDTVQLPESTTGDKKKRPSSNEENVPRKKIR